ncbi:MAG: MltA-interacting MipA family protein [Desulfobulbaceae bacterium]|nr:MAG: MltA-interacting MipA family protein [Desulfobulbaceae bacterium]
MNTLPKSICLLALILCLPCSIMAQETSSELPEPDTVADQSLLDCKEQKWGIGFGVRVASTPFKGDDSSLHDLIPLLYYEDDYLYLDGLEGGLKLLNADQWQLRLLARWRFFDVPDDDYDHLIDTDVLDWGLQLRYQPHDTPLYFEADIMADERQRLSSNWRAGMVMQTGPFIVDPYVNLRLKDWRFNDYYYGLGVDDIGSGLDVSIGVEATYPLAEDVFLLASLEATWLDGNARGSMFVEDDFQENIFVGVSYQNGSTTICKSALDAKPFVRMAHGWATPSDLADIIAFNRERDKENNQLTSIFYGHPLADDLFGLPIQSYLTPGAVWHWHSDVQNSGQEYVLAFKHFYTFDWPVTWRIGVGEGLSYAANISYIEQTEMDDKDIEASKWLLYLDFSLELELGDLTGLTSLDDMWLGYSIHHRSGIFGSSSMFGNIKGGSNYNTVTLQYHF